MSSYQYSFIYRSKGQVKRRVMQNYTGESFAIVDDNGPCQNASKIVPYDDMGCLCIHKTSWSIEDAIPVATYEDVDFGQCDEVLYAEAMVMVLKRFENLNNVAVGGIRGLISLIDAEDESI